MGLAVGAGFGGAALIRGQEFGFGPVIVIETLLSVVDRQLDRQLATERYQTVHELMVRVAELMIVALLVTVVFGVIPPTKSRSSA